jgi:hypothetical protein
MMLPPQRIDPAALSIEKEKKFLPGRLFKPSPERREIPGTPGQIVLKEDEGAGANSLEQAEKVRRGRGPLKSQNPGGVHEGELAS